MYNSIVQKIPYALPFPGGRIESRYSDNKLKGKGRTWPSETGFGSHVILIPVVTLNVCGCVLIEYPILQ